MTRACGELTKSAEYLLAELAGRKPRDRSRRRSAHAHRERDLAALLAADLVVRNSAGAIEVTPAGLAHVARNTPAIADIDPFRAQHLDLSQRAINPTDGAVIIDDSESPLAWLARRKGRDGRPLIAPVQLQAGERLRAEFTRAQLMPRTTSNWGATVTDDLRGAGAAAHFTESVIAARQRLRHALDAVGPELSGLLLDVCCFLKNLADIEQERGWPSRSAKVVLQLGLDRLARHYGLDAQARGPARAPVRTWLAPGATFVVEE